MEHDSIGALNVPAEAYYGVQSMRAATNFQIIHRPLHPVLIDSIVMVKKEAEFDDILKMGRTQLQDAVPMRLGQSFGAFAHVLKRDIKRLKNIMDEMKVLNIGATAINVDPYYLVNISYELSKGAGISLKQADNLIDATQNLDGFVSVSGVLKTCAVDISKISNDLRLMSSGPRTGLSEINLPARQNGSSIMPGKINPVIPEVVSQVAYLIIGHDYTITMAAEAGQLELNAFEPVLFHHLFESIDTLKEAAATLTKHCITGITANKGQCEEYIEKSVGIQKKMKSKKRLWRNSELLLLQYPLAQDIIHK